MSQSLYTNFKKQTFNALALDTRDKIRQVAYSVLYNARGGYTPTGHKIIQHLNKKEMWYRSLFYNREFDLLAAFSDRFSRLLTGLRKHLCNYRVSVKPEVGKRSYVDFSKLSYDNYVEDCNIVPAEEVDNVSSPSKFVRRSRRIKYIDDTVKNKVKKDLNFARHHDELAFIRNLRYKIREKILAYRNQIYILSKKSKNLRSFIRDSLIENQNGPEQIQEPAQPSVSQANNTILTEPSGSMCEVVDLPARFPWHEYVSSDVTSNFETITNRWLRINSYKWTTQQTFGNDLAQLSLPRDALRTVNLCNLPNTIPFKVHRYWRGDIHVKIQINCNKFQIGQLQAAWYYNLTADKNFRDRQDMYTRSGTHHAIISAAPNNEVDMIIPFKSHKSMLHTKENSNNGQGAALYLGDLFISVLSPLKTSGETSTSCTFTVFIKFVDSQFTGTIAGDVDPMKLTEDIIENQMDIVPQLLPIVERMLVGSQNDGNRDNPPDVFPPTYVVPTATHSWANGTGLPEPVHSLRLNPLGQTVHLDTNVDEMKIEHVVNKFMLHSRTTWSQQLSTGTLLWSCPVNPIPPKDKLRVIRSAESSKLRMYQLTSVGFVSSLFNYWRGSLEFRFDFVASMFHSGKLLLAYVPGILETFNITLSQARACPHVVISLDETLSYTWTVPYIADRPWWPRRYAGESEGNNYGSPSKLCVFVLNELVIASNIPPEIDILIYMRGGPDFEVAVPVQPAIGISREYFASNDNTIVYPIGDTDTYYSGDWHETVGNVQVFRRATTSDAYGTFSTGITDRAVYYVLYGNYPQALLYNRPVDIKMCVFLISPSHFGGFVGVPIVGAVRDTIRGARLKQICDAVVENKFTFGTWLNNFIATDTGEGISTSLGFLSSNFSTTSNTYGGGKNYPWSAVTFDTSDFEVVNQGNREMAGTVLSVSKNLPTTGHGYMLYGEKFNDLKDLTRRWQVYGYQVVPKENVERDPASCSFIAPLLPQGLNLDIHTGKDINQMWNRAREGHIPLIASMYRYFRGSMRIRLTVTNCSGLTLWMQHRPDRQLQYDTMVTCKQVSTAEAVFNHTYGMYMQALDVNNTVELELPYYQMANYGLLQRPNLMGPKEILSFFSLGELCVGFFGDQPTSDIRVVMYYSLADDCRFSTFQGPPPCVLLDDLPEFLVVNQGPLDIFRPKKTGKMIAQSAIEAAKEEVTPMIAEMSTSIFEKLKSVMSDFKINMETFDVQGKLTACLFQIGQAINNPTWSTIAIACASIFVSLGLITVGAIVSAKKLFKSIWNYIISFAESKLPKSENDEPTPSTSTGITRKKCSISKKQRVESSGNPFSDDDDDIENQSDASEIMEGLCALICGGLATALGVCCKGFKSISITTLTAGLVGGMRTANIALVFFKNLFKVVGECKVWLISKLWSGVSLAEQIQKERDIIEQWSRMSLYLINPRISVNIKHDTNLQHQLIDCYAMGQLMKMKASELKYPALNSHINDIFNKLHKINVELAAQGINPHVRKMPFTIYNFGSPNLGKSHMVNTMCSVLCEEESITSQTGLTCVLNATSKFWDNCDRQPCLIMDDAFNIQKGTMLEEQIAHIFNIVSPVLLVPPKAALEDKGRAYAPDIFVMNSNYAYFKTDIVKDEALWRRRDIMIHTVANDSFNKEGCKHCEERMHIKDVTDPDTLAKMSDYHHLKFQYKVNCIDEEAPWEPQNDFLTFSQLMTILKKKFKENRVSEQYKFLRRIEEMNKIKKVETIVHEVGTLQNRWNDSVKERMEKEKTLRETTIKNIISNIKTTVSDKIQRNQYKFECKVKDILRIKYTPSIPNVTCNECTRIQRCCKMCEIERIACEEQFENVSKCDAPRSSPENINTDPKTMTYHDEFDAIFNQDSTNWLDDSSIKVNDYCKKWFADLALCKTGKQQQLRLRKFILANKAEILGRLSSYMVSVRGPSLFQHILTAVIGNYWCKHCDSDNYTCVNGDYIYLPDNKPLKDVINEIDNDGCHNKCIFDVPWTYEGFFDRLVKRNKVKPDWMLLYSRKLLQVETKFWDDIMAGLSLFVNRYIMETYIAIKKRPLYTLLYAIFIGGIGYTIFHSVTDVLCFLFGDKTNSGKVYSDPAKGRVNKIVVPRPPKFICRENVVENQAMMSQQFLQAEKLVLDNMVTIVRVDNIDNSLHQATSCLMLQDRDMLIERHYWESWKKKAESDFYFVSSKVQPLEGDVGIHVNILECPVKWLGAENGSLQSNLGVVTLPLKCPQFKNLLKHMATSKQHEYINTNACWFIDCLTKRTRQCLVTPQYNKEYPASDVHRCRLNLCYSYQYTGRGLCGSVLLCSSMERPIIGIHFAGSPWQGYAEPLFQDSFDSSDNVENKEYTNEEQYKNYGLELDDEDATRINFRTMLYPQGVMPKEYAHHQSSETNYTLSSIYDTLPNDCEPAPLHPRDPRLPEDSSPLRTGCEQMGKPPKDFPLELVQKASKDLERVILDNVIPVRPVGLLSMQDAVCGNPDVKGFEPLCWTTSEGFPLSKVRPPRFSGKKWLFKLDETGTGFKLLGVHPELRRIMSCERKSRELGIKVPTVFIDCLKDSIMSREKCKIPGKTRIFSISPVQYTIEFKRFFGDFLASYQNAGIKAEHGIGIDVNSIQWTEVANYLQAKGTHIVAGDYKNYGPSLMFRCVSVACDVIMAWYKRYDDDPYRQKIRRVMLSELVGSYHLCLNLVYRPPCGIPSGSPITTPLNSLVNSIYIRCGWMTITKTPVVEFRKQCNILTYGDDVCVNVSDEYIKSFNTATLSLFFKKYSIVFTDIDKSDTIIPSRTLENVTFLKRGFKPVSDMDYRFLAPIEIDSIFKCSNWISRKGDPVLNTLENCVQCCELAFGHGQEYYDSLKEKLQVACLQKLGKSFSAPTWCEMFERCFPA